MDADARQWLRLTLGQVMMFIAGVAVVLAAFGVKESVILPMLAFLAVEKFLLRLLLAVWPVLGRVLFGYRGPVAEEWIDEERARELWRAGLRLCHEGRDPEALEVLAPLEAVRPNDASLALVQAYCYRRMGYLDQAVRVLERAEWANAREAVIHYALACVRSGEGMVPLALDSLSLALELEPALRDSVAEEPDFEAIRGEEDYARLMDLAGPVS